MSFSDYYNEEKSTENPLMFLLKEALLKHSKYVVGFFVALLVGIYYLLSTYFGMSLTFTNPSDTWVASESYNNVAITGSNALENSHSTEDSNDIFVDVSGAVLNPGVYKLDAKSVVGDALKLAGPILNDASADWVAYSLNLAAPLNNYEKIYIPFEHTVSGQSIEVPFDLNLSSIGSSTKPSSSSQSPKPDANTASAGDNSSTGSDTSDLINFNTASLEEIKTLSGIGDAYATKIISSRPYTDAADFKQKGVIPNATFTKISDQITF